MELDNTIGHFVAVVAEEALELGCDGGEVFGDATNAAHGGAEIAFVHHHHRLTVFVEDGHAFVVEEGHLFGFAGAGGGEVGDVLGDALNVAHHELELLIVVADEALGVAQHVVDGAGEPLEVRHDQLVELVERGALTIAVDEAVELASDATDVGGDAADVVVELLGDAANVGDDVLRLGQQGVGAGHAADIHDAAAVGENHR